MPAYESESGALLVMENLLAFFSPTSKQPPVFLPAGYGMASLRAPSGLTALHDDPDAVWSWRPLLYSMRLDGTQRLGSQQELEWRWGLHQAEMAKADLQDALDEFTKWCLAERKSHDDYLRLAHAFIDEWWKTAPELEFSVANRRAAALLREHLSPQQRLDLEARNGFYVRGEVNRLYFVEPGNGFDIVHPVTHHLLVSLCLHPEEWIPHDDVALATKLALDSGREGEAELLEAARPRLVPGRTRPTEHETAAARLELRYLLV